MQHPCEAGSATQKPVVSTSAGYSLRLAGEADILSGRSRLHSQTMLPPWHGITSVSGSLQISIQVNRESLLRTKMVPAPLNPLPLFALHLDDQRFQFEE